MRADEPEDRKGAAKPASAEPEAVLKCRRVYVLHSGLHTLLSTSSRNIAAENLREGLLKRGVAESNLVVMDNPFPAATWTSVFPKSALTMYFEFVDPSTKMSQESYLRMHKALQAQGVGRNDDVVWIGHSAGGQVGLTMANLAANLWKYPDLVKDTVPYRFDMVITLGAPLGSDNLPPSIKLRHYYSGEDKVVRWASKVGGGVGLTLGYKTKLTKMPARIGDNCKVRCFCEVDHPSWDVDQRVLDRILGEATNDYRPLWYSTLCTTRPGYSLSQLMCQALDAECHVSVEDPPKGK